MIPEPLLYAVLLFALADLFVLGAAAWAVVGTGPGGRDGAEPYVDDARVECPRCGADNERGYRFCWHCVGELPAADGRALGAAPARDRSPF